MCTTKGGFSAAYRPRRLNFFVRFTTYRHFKKISWKLQLNPSSSLGEVVVTGYIFDFRRFLILEDFVDSKKKLSCFLGLGLFVHNSFSHLKNWYSVPWHAFVRVGYRLFRVETISAAVSGSSIPLKLSPRPREYKKSYHLNN